MLKAPAAFPHPGSTAFVRPTGEEVRILQTIGAYALIATAFGSRRYDQSRNRRLILADLAESREDAVNVNTDPRPRRIQLVRRKGWRMPKNTVKVDRSTKWGNPFGVGDNLGSSIAAAMYAGAVKTAALREHHGLPVDLSELEGKNLACWCDLCDVHCEGLPLGSECPDCEPCHADALLEAANA